MVGETGALITRAGGRGRVGSGGLAASVTTVTEAERGKGGVTGAVTASSTSGCLMVLGSEESAFCLFPMSVAGNKGCGGGDVAVGVVMDSFTSSIKGGVMAGTASGVGEP